MNEEEEGGVMLVPVREESSEVTAVEGHSDILFDAATHASEGHLLDRYRNRLGPIFEDVLRNVRSGFLDGYKVRTHNWRLHSIHCGPRRHFPTHLAAATCPQ